MTTEELLDRIAEEGLLNTRQCEAVRRRVQRTGQDVWQAVLELKYCDEEKLYPLIADVNGMQLVDGPAVPADEEAEKLLPARIALMFRCAPIELNGGIISIAFAMPPEAGRVEQLELLTGCKVQPMLCQGSQVDQRIALTYGLGAGSFADVSSKVAGHGDDPNGASRGEGAGAEDDENHQAQSRASRMVNHFIEEALRTGATDVHVEQYRRRLQVRFRVDGRLRDVPLPAGIESLSDTIVSRIKVLGQLDITERRLPQDGRMRFKRANGVACDLRISTLPTRFGENICLRLLNLERLCLPMDELGLDDRQLRRLRQLVTAPNGLILVTGPTGSGKTTTLYSILTHLRDKMGDVKIITVEDPVEYEMQGITQIQTNAGIGLTFSAALRAILRHDPDVILIGEIRDRETADIAVQAALTGHLVFATLHTNDAVSAVSRLLNMGIAPDLVAASLRGVLAQRLVRRVCAECAIPDADVPDELAEEIGHVARRNGMLVSTPMAPQSGGCRRCGGTGYSGRVALYEMLFVTPELEELIERGASATAIRTAAMRNGLQTLREDGWNKVAKGVTSIAEVLRVAPVPIDPAQAD